MARAVWLTAVELADRWRLAPKTINKRIYEGRGLPRHFKVGDAPNSPVRFRLTDVEAYEAEHMGGAA